MKNREMDKNFQYLTIVLENCDCYEIDAKNIVNLRYRAVPLGRENTYKALDGVIVISANAKDTIENWVKQSDAIGTDLDIRLKDRLTYCSSGVDVTGFTLTDKQGCKRSYSLPYDPLLGILRGREIELSNCPSIEIDGDGNMIIAFGRSSKQPTRKDNDYCQLVEGWERKFGTYKPKVLKGKLQNFGTFGDKQRILIVGFEIRGKKQFAELVFLNCKHFGADVWFPTKGNCALVMSKTMDGRIYVGFDGIGIDFFCDSVLEYEYYCQRDEEIT